MTNFSAQLFLTRFFFQHEFNFLSRSFSGTTLIFFLQLFLSCFFSFLAQPFPRSFCKPLTNNYMGKSSEITIVGTRPPWLVILYLVFIVIMKGCAGVLLPYFPTLDNEHVNCDGLVECYFITGLGYDEILLFVGLLHGIIKKSI